MTNTPLTDIQKAFVERMLVNQSYGVYMRPGMGKTRTVIETLRILKQQNNFFTTLVLCPIITMHNVWEAELKKWDAPFSHAFIEGSYKYETPEGSEIYFASLDLFTYDKKNTARDWGVKQLLARIRPEIIVIDESSKFKNITAFRTMNLILQLYQLEVNGGRIRAVAKKYKRLYLLSGTPQPKNINNMFAQAFILDGGALLGTNADNFENYFFRLAAKRGTITAVKAIWHVLKPLCATAENSYLANNIKYNTITVALEPETMQTYKAILNASMGTFLLFFAVTEKNDASHDTVCIKRLITEKGLPQLLTSFTSGSLYCTSDDEVLDPRGFFTVSNAKIEMLRNLVASLQNTPVMVACNYNHEIARIGRMLTDMKIAYAQLTGKTQPKIKIKTIDKWNAKKLPVLLCNPAAMGHGLNLQQGGSTIVWFSIPRFGDYELYEQFNARLNRTGQTEQVLVHHLVCKNTFDEIAFSSLRRKKNIAQAFLDFLKI